MQTIGERLEEARKKKGISIREAAEATKIRGDYLSKFENNQFDINLTELYVRGFLRTYAQFLRLPADRIINDYAALGRGDTRPRQPSREIYGRMDVSIASSEERAEPPPPAPVEPPAAAQTVRRAANAGRRVGTGSSSNIDPALVFKSLKWVGLAVLAILVLWGVKALFSSATADRVTKTPASSATVSPVVPTVAEPTVTLIASDTVRVKVVAVSDGRVLLPDTTLVRGQTQVVPKPGAIYITYTAGKNLEVEVNGRRYGMPTAGYDRAKIE